MALTTINVLLTSFSGLGLPPTLSLPISSSTSVCNFIALLESHLPMFQTRLIITTSSNKMLSPTSPSSLSTLLQNPRVAILPLRLTVPLCGGKGGFGSQLRAAGGRMSSRRKKNGEAVNSNRNLDGRRIRTVNEAKALAEYLALKPEMDKKEKEARRKRWEQVVELAEKREEEIRRGAKGRVDGKWVEDKEEAEERAREAVEAAMKGDWRDNLMGGLGKEDESGSEDDGESGDDEMGESSGTSVEVDDGEKSKGKVEGVRTYFGFDDDDEFMSESEEDENGGEGVFEDGEDGRVSLADIEQAEPVAAGKGKGKA